MKALGYLIFVTAIAGAIGYKADPVNFNRKICWMIV